MRTRPGELIIPGGSSRSRESGGQQGRHGPAFEGGGDTGADTASLGTRYVVACYKR